MITRVEFTRAGLALTAAVAFLGCLLTATILHDPVPRIHDEFSYALIGDTLARGHASGPAPPLPEFFETFHVLVRPTHASKYFPAQGIFLAIGERLTGHQPVGIWLSSALACAGTAWMLQAWIGRTWGLLGGLLMVIQYGIFSYWSQSYWGGMVAALGGALFFGAIRRLWDRFSWQSSLWLGFGLVVIATSRPLEGFLAVLPTIMLFLHHLWHDRRWNDSGFWLKLLLPCFAILSCGVFAMGAYNHAITGSAFATPYQVNEQQYQESPPFIFMPLRPRVNYSSPMLQYYYEVSETKLYVTSRVPKWFVTGVTRRLATWWQFYCGFLLSIPLVLPAVLRGGRARLLQIGIVAGLITLSFFSNPTAIAIRGLIDLLVLTQIALTWYVFHDKWSRVAIATCTLLLFEQFFTKWAFPHYFAPAACLILFLEVEGLRRIWNWNPGSAEPHRPLTRTERRRIARENESRRKPAFTLRWVIYALPVACVVSLVLRVEGRLNGWNDDPHGPDRQTLLMNDWSLRRADLEKWLQQQRMPQLVFVRYGPHHGVNFEWVYNHADIMRSHVIWARDLGAEHNRDLLKLLPDRTAWLLEADKRDPQLAPYSEVDSRATVPVAAPATKPNSNLDQDQLD